MNRTTQRTTVVGGRAPNSDPANAIPFSGIEQALKLAAGDMAFRENLFRRRSRALLEVGIDLSRSDARIIDDVSESQLRSLVRVIVVRYRRSPTAGEFES